MHAYDVPRRQSLASVPAPVRPAQDSRSGLSATPIYDALYTEYVKSFRSLPGDRSGEEELGFTAFGNIPHSTGSYGGHSPGSFGASLASGAYGSYGAEAGEARHGDTRHGEARPPQWQRVGTVGRTAPGMHHVPAGLPPAPRRGA
ncbi:MULTISPECIES: hypothetical protein [unclassified Streptomyces]|uniref:hypothetical protein n=1 Tax=unclassified Streptomyces TaxID=2593676 RepID=UPI000F6D65AA|nr:MULTISPECIES: hypothetical protein [unclassified Streptomyces]AZM63101.1 hypothetical protein DLM49_29295 [Streptomyces sp. WAC 01438]RSN00549.1 hypothetical protein DMA10_02705 [Streptomyces sp. WAC 01420]